MKAKLFSGKSLLVSLKSIGSNIIVGLSALPFWLLMYWLVSIKHMPILGGFFGLIIFAWYLFFWGFLGQKLWRWN